MSESFTDVTAAPAPVPPKKPAGRRTGLLCLLGFLVLAAGEGYLWRLVHAQSDVSALTDLQRQVAALRAAPPAATPPSLQGLADLTEKLAALTAQVNAMQGLLASDHGALTAMQASQADLTKLTAKIAALNQMAVARMALEAGQPLGTIANAPPALAAFATVAPPTMASLILTYPAAARAAAAASVSDTGKASYWSRVVARLENFVTISDGTHVIVGAPAAAVLEQAGALLNAGDLAGAVADISTLSVSTQAAMGSWLTNARALLAARNALMAAN
jgi:hypothetical protein